MKSKAAEISLSNRWNGPSAKSIFLSLQSPSPNSIMAPLWFCPSHNRTQVDINNTQAEERLEQKGLRTQTDLVEEVMKPDGALQNPVYESPPRLFGSVPQRLEGVVALVVFSPVEQCHSSVEAAIIPFAVLIAAAASALVQESVGFAGESGPCRARRSLGEVGARRRKWVAVKFGGDDERSKSM